ncbi:hypothetical protein D9M72_564640 [compost metagenome]
MLLQEQRIAGGGFDRGITEDSGDADQVDSRMTMQEKQRHRIVDARVRIKDDFVHCVLLFLFLCLTARNGGKMAVKVNLPRGRLGRD